MISYPPELLLLNRSMVKSLVKYLLDTNLIIDFLKAKPETINKLSPLFAEGMAISIITAAEYLQGIFQVEDNQHALKLFLEFLNQAKIEVLNIDWEIAEVYAKLQAKAEQIGRRLPSFDLLIASTALVYNLTLISDDKIFTKIKNLKLT